MIRSEFLRWLLGIDQIPTDAPLIQFAWERPWPAWMWALLLLCLGAYAFWTYSRLAGRPAGRWLLATARLGVLALLLAVLSGPLLQMPRETVERDWVVSLVDRSASMSIADVPGSSGRVPREDQLRALLGSTTSVWNEISDSRHLLWLGFHYGAFNFVTPRGDIEQGTSLPVDLTDPSGQRTSINTAMEQALQRTAARPVSGILLFSDGRTSDPPARAVIRRLQSERIPVFVVPLGSEKPVGDIAIRRVDSPRRAFIRDEVPVTVQIDQLGEEALIHGATLRLVDVQTGEQLDSERLAPGDNRDAVTLTATPQLAGEAIWEVVLETLEPDLIPANNRKEMSITLVDRPLRVLFVEGYPRWEYRYLKTLLVREQTIDSSVFLISADRDFAQEGNQPITRLPNSPEEFAQFDVVVLGDVPSGFFSSSQLEMIREHVSIRGAGLLCIGGERSMPGSYGGSVIADLLPMRGSLGLPTIGSPVTMKPTGLADRLGVLQLGRGDGPGWPAELSDPAYGWSQLFWAQRIEQGLLKPTAEVLAETQDMKGGGAFPLVIAMRYGAGQSIYVATDEIWRWRWGRGEFYPDQFWVQMIRYLGRQSLSGAGQRAALTAEPRRVAVRQPVQLSLRLLEQSLISERRTSVAAVIEDKDGQTITELELVPSGDPSRMDATWFPTVIGELKVRVKDHALSDMQLDALLEVYAPDDELRQPESDHSLLAALARETGGRVLDADSLADLPELLPNRSVRTIHPLSERLWDTPLVFGLLLLLLGFEWVGRKVMRLA